MRLSLLLLVACGPEGGDPAAETDAPEDTAADSAAPPLDTGLALVHDESSATLGAPEYVYGPYGYVYPHVLLCGYSVGETTRWQMTARATLEEDWLLHEARYADLRTYNAL